MADSDAIAIAQAQAQLIAEKLVAESGAPGEENNGEEYNNKRKYEGDGETADESVPLRKRASFNGPDDGVRACGPCQLAIAA
jgi:hypothetical protein